MPFIELNNLRDEQATGYLIRENIKTLFRYKTVKPRTFMFNDAIVGWKAVVARMTIQTQDDLKFAEGDQILLEEIEKPLRVVNITKELDEKQYMFLKEASVKYTLDLA